jgi:hypothetical protein
MGDDTWWTEVFFSRIEVETDAYLLACCRYVELNPVRACMSDDTAAYIPGPVIGGMLELGVSSIGWISARVSRDWGIVTMNGQCAPGNSCKVRYRRVSGS